MKTIEAIKAVMNMQGVRNADLARRMDMSPSAVSMKLRQKDLTAGALAEIMRNVDYKVVLVPSRARIPEGGIEVE